MNNGQELIVTFAVTVRPHIQRALDEAFSRTINSPL